MKQKFKFFIFIISIAFISTVEFANAAIAEQKCELNKIPLAGKYSEIIAKYKIKHDAEQTNSKYFEMQARGSDFCNDFARNIEVKLIFVENKLSKITFNNFNTEKPIEEIVKKSFGESNAKTIANKYGNNDVVTWKLENANAVYSKAGVAKNSKVKKVTGVFEILNISAPEFSKKISEHSTKQEE